jgi:hypothetical protein
LQSSPYNTFDVIEIPKDVELTCTDIKIEDKNYPNTKLIFSPKTLKDKIYVYYKPFNFPFKVDNFYYIISPSDKFYLIYNDAKSREYADSLIENLPDRFKQNVLVSTTKQLNGKNIFINSNPGNANDIKITINQDKVSLNYKNKVYEDVPIELVYGAIFSDDFDCVYNKLKPNLEKTILTYQNKITLLQSSTCSYSPFMQYLSKLKEVKYTNTKSVEELNKNLASLNCPTLY